MTQQIEISPEAGYIAKNRECDWKSEQILLLTQVNLELRQKVEAQAAELEKLRPTPAPKTPRKN